MCWLVSWRPPYRPLGTATDYNLLWLHVFACAFSSHKLETSRSFAVDGGKPSIQIILNLWCGQTTTMSSRFEIKSLPSRFWKQYYNSSQLSKFQHVAHSGRSGWGTKIPLCFAFSNICRNGSKLAWLQLNGARCTDTGISISKRSACS